VKIEGMELDTVMKTSYLGVNIDSSLDWKIHTKAKSSKVSRAIGFLKHARKFLPQDTLKILYKGIVEPHFRGCCSLWGCYGKMNSTNCNSCKTETQKLWRTAAMMLQVSLYWINLNGKAFKNL